jgi:anti-anti-sigma regulatory factor
MIFHAADAPVKKNLDRPRRRATMVAAIPARPDVVDQEPTMAAPQGTVRVHRNDQCVTFQVVGWGTMKQSLALRRCGEQGLAGGVKLLRVDLRHCTYLDSTFLGTLLWLQRAARRRGAGEMLLVSPSGKCCGLFKQLGVDTAFATVTEDEPDAGCWTELVSDADNSRDFNCNVVQAHQELANLGGKAAATFREVADRLSKEWNCPPNP